MDTLAETRGLVDSAASAADRQAALIALASALYEYDAGEAVAVAEEAMVLADSRGDTHGRAWALHHRGWAVAALGRLDEALADQLAVLDEFERQRDRRGIAHALMAIGDIHGEIGDSSVSLEYLERAVAPMEEADDKAGRAALMNLTAIVLSHEGRHDEAAHLLEQVEAIYASLDDPLRVTMAKINRGFELLSLAETQGTGDLVPEAAELASEAIEVGRALQDGGRSTLAYARSLMAQVLASLGDEEGALVESAIAVAVASEGGFDTLATEIGLDRVGWLTSAGRLQEASELLDEIDVSSRKSDNRRSLARATELRADLRQALGDTAGALASYREFHRMDKDLHSDAAERRARLTSARLQIERAHNQAELAQMRVAELEALDQEKRDFLASVSHELRTPLAAVLGFASELAEAWDGFEPEEARGIVRLIARQSSDISNIVDDLLTITRVEAGTMSIYPADLDLTEAVGGLVEVLGREANREVGWSGNARVWADPTRLRQILRNLVINAFRYGGPQVRVVAQGSQDGVVVVEVRDSGGPIPPGRVATMFDSFDHTDDGEKNPSSVGLGLAVARSLARLMGGDLVYDYDGESIFRLTLVPPTAK